MCNTCLGSYYAHASCTRSRSSNVTAMHDWIHHVAATHGNNAATIHWHSLHRATPQGVKPHPHTQPRSRGGGKRKQRLPQVRARAQNGRGRGRGGRGVEGYRDHAMGKSDHEERESRTPWSASNAILQYAPPRLFAALVPCSDSHCTEQHHKEPNHTHARRAAVPSKANSV